jgi:hypothetical protein
VRELVAEERLARHSGETAMKSDSLMSHLLYKLNVDGYARLGQRSCGRATQLGKPHSQYQRILSARDMASKIRPRQFCLTMDCFSSSSIRCRLLERPRDLGLCVAVVAIVREPPWLVGWWEARAVGDAKRLPAILVCSPRLWVIYPGLECRPKEEKRSDGRRSRIEQMVDCVGLSPQTWQEHLIGWVLTARGGEKVRGEEGTSWCLSHGRNNARW